MDVKFDYLFVEGVKNLYGKEWNLYGPYIGKDSRKRVVLYDGRSRKTRQLAKLKMEVRLGRLLVKGEEVDHIDDDCTNDDITNLQVITGTQNRQKAIKAKFGEKISIPCSYCAKVLTISKSRKYGIKKFCNQACYTKYKSTSVAESV